MNCKKVKKNLKKSRAQQNKVAMATSSVNNDMSYQNVNVLLIVFKVWRQSVKDRKVTFLAYVKLSSKTNVNF